MSTDPDRAINVGRPAVGYLCFPYLFYPLNRLAYSILGSRNPLKSD